MRTARRRGDSAGIALLLALIAAAFVPAAMEEARALLPYLSSVAHTLKGEALVEGVSEDASTEGIDCECEPHCSTGAVYSLVGLLPRPYFFVGACQSSAAKPLRRPDHQGTNSPRAPPAA